MSPISLDHAVIWDWLSRRNTTLIPLSFFYQTTLALQTNSLAHWPTSQPTSQPSALYQTTLAWQPLKSILSLHTNKILLHSKQTIFPRLNYRPTHLSLYFFIILLIYQQTLDSSNLSLLLDLFIDQSTYLSTLQNSLALQTLKLILRSFLFLNNNNLQTNTWTATNHPACLLACLFYS